MSIYILAIETSCDETAIAISKDDKIIVSLVASQIKLHQPYGGVVPEIAAREHIQTIIPLIHEAMSQANITQKDISAISATAGPGLSPSLMIGIDTAKNLAFAWNKPFIATNHLHGHIYSLFLEDNMPKNPFPLLTLLVSGGHTQIILMTDHLSFKVLGKTRDDAAGEAFDKVASMLDLPYPGGPEISKQATGGKPDHYRFTTPLQKEKTLDFSFSGTKTQALRHLQQEHKITADVIQNMSASFQAHTTTYLLSNLFEAAHQTTPKTIAITGGVSANTRLRDHFIDRCKLELPETIPILPQLKHTTDNAAMIARATYEQYKRGDFADFSTIANPKLSI